MGRARTPTTTESLMRWLAAWLALAICVQALAVGTVALRGLGHRHGSLDVEGTPMLLWRHAAGSHHARDAHQRAHAAGEAHQHAPDDASVLGSDAHAAAMAAFVSAPAPRASGAVSVAPDALSHVQTATALWSPTARAVAPALQPPRA